MINIFQFVFTSWYDVSYGPAGIDLTFTGPLKISYSVNITHSILVC